MLPDVAPVEQNGAVGEQTIEEHRDVREKDVADSGEAVGNQVLAVGKKRLADAEEVFRPVPDAGGAALVHGLVALQALAQRERWSRRRRILVI